MRKIHLAIAADDIEKTVEDYSKRLHCDPCVVVPNEYALWRTESVNISVRQDRDCKSGELRHLGWEDDNATEFTTEVDVNGVPWEKFSAHQQAEEIEKVWPGTGYEPE